MHNLITTALRLLHRRNDDGAPLALRIDQEHAADMHAIAKQAESQGSERLRILNHRQQQSIQRGRIVEEPAV